MGSTEVAVRKVQRVMKRICATGNGRGGWRWKKVLLLCEYTEVDTELKSQVP